MYATGELGWHKYAFTEFSLCLVTLGNFYSDVRVTYVILKTNYYIDRTQQQKLIPDVFKIDHIPNTAHSV